MNVTAHTQQLIAPAKLTLSLRITGLRSDGFHLIEAIMTTLELHDVLTVIDDSHGLSFTGPFAEGLKNDASNLVTRALTFVQRSANIVVTKNIPHGGGLGGGSTDAAAILRWAGRTSPSDVIDSATLGADVPFCLVGGQAQVSGIGEIIKPISLEPQKITLIVPPLHVSTPKVYQAWDAMGGPRSDGPNDLEPAAIQVEPELARWRDRIREVTGVSPVLAGSGATWFVANQLSEQGQALREALPDAHVIETQTRQ